MPQTYILDQYKAYLGDVANIGTRYTTAQTFYLSIVSALIALVGFAGKDASTISRLGWWLALFVLFVIALICYVWWRTLDFYGHLFEAKFAVLKEIEAKNKDGFFEIFALEREKLGGRTLIRHEKFIPLIIGLAAVFGAGTIAKIPLAIV